MNSVRGVPASTGASTAGTGGGAGVDSMMQFMQAQLLMQSKNPMYTMLIIMLLGFLVPFVRQVADAAMAYVTQLIKRRTDSIEAALLAKRSETRAVIDTKTKKVLYENVVRFVRNYKEAGDWTTADAVLDLIFAQSNARHLRIHADVETVSNRQPIDVYTDDNLHLVFQIVTQTFAEDGAQLHALEFELRSTQCTTSEIRRWVKSVARVFIDSKANKMDERRYFFDHVSPESTNGGIHMQSQSTLFSMTPFQTNRTLENVFFDRDSELKHRVRFFKDNKAWYDARGVPYTLGFLFTGPPGTGKTSSVKAIAAELDRHVFNISLAAIRTKSQLKRLFYDPTVSALVTPSARQTKDLLIPIDRRLYVIEDMDCMDGENSFLMRRDVDAATRSAIEQKRQEQAEKRREKRVHGYAQGDDGDAFSADTLDLATILNALDGTLETPGRVILFTSNHPERLDTALVRPGRIDAMIEFGYCTRDMIARLYANFYESEADEDTIAQLPNLTWTPAEVSQVFFRYFQRPHQALAYMLETDPAIEFRPPPMPTNNTTPLAAAVALPTDGADANSSGGNDGVALILTSGGGVSNYLGMSLTSKERDDMYENGGAPGNVAAPSSDKAHMHNYGGDRAGMGPVHSGTMTPDQNGLNETPFADGSLDGAPAPAPSGGFGSFTLF